MEVVTVPFEHGMPAFENLDEEVTCRSAAGPHFAFAAELDARARLDKDAESIAADAASQILGRRVS